MNGTVEKILENPTVRTGGKIGAVIVGAAVSFKIGKFIWSKTGKQRAQLKEQFDKVRVKLSDAIRPEEVSTTSTEEGASA